MNPASLRPRIGVDFHTFDGIYQGSRSHILGLYQEAIAQAPDMQFVFLLQGVKRLRREYPAFDAPNVRLVPLARARGLVRIGWQLSLLQRKLRLDLLHMQYRLPLVPLGDCACTIHDTLFETHPQFFDAGFVRMSRMTSRHAAQRARLLFTVSEYSRQEIARLYGVEPQRIAITTNAVDAKRFFPGDEGAGEVQALGLAPGRYLCTVGRLEPRKNHLNLLHAYASLPQPKPPLVLVGQRDFRSDAVFSLVRALGLAPEVRILQDVPDPVLPALLRHAAVFVYPSFAEGFGMPVVEAMACGVPVVTSNTTALREVAGDAALTADPESPASIAQAIGRLLADPALRGQASERGMQQARRYDWRHSAQVLVDAYRGHFERVGQVRSPRGGRG